MGFSAEATIFWTMKMVLNLIRLLEYSLHQQIISLSLASIIFISIMRGVGGAVRGVGYRLWDLKAENGVQLVG